MKSEKDINVFPLEIQTFFFNSEHFFLNPNNGTEHTAFQIFISWIQRGSLVDIYM